MPQRFNCAPMDIPIEKYKPSITVDGEVGVECDGEGFKKGVGKLVTSSLKTMWILDMVQVGKRCGKDFKGLTISEITEVLKWQCEDVQTCE